jgi:hypothetical protein
MNPDVLQLQCIVYHLSIEVAGLEPAHTTYHTAALITMSFKSKREDFFCLEGKDQAGFESAAHWFGMQEHPRWLQCLSIPKCTPAKNGTSTSVETVWNLSVGPCQQVALMRMTEMNQNSFSVEILSPIRHFLVIVDCRFWIENLRSCGSIERCRYEELLLFILFSLAGLNDHVWPITTWERASRNHFKG